MKSLLFILLFTLSSYSFSAKDTSIYTERYFNSVDIGFTTDGKYINANTSNGGFGLNIQGQYLILKNVYTQANIKQFSRYLDYKNDSYDLGSRTELYAGLGLRQPVIFYFLSNRSKELELSTYANVISVFESVSNTEIESIDPTLMGNHFKTGIEYGISTTFVTVDKKVRRNGFVKFNINQKLIQNEVTDTKLKFHVTAFLEDYEKFQPYFSFSIRVEDSSSNFDIGLKYAF